MKNIEILIALHSEWIKENTTSKQLSDDCFLITTPFVDRHNDMIQLIIRTERDHIHISDNGYTLNDLEISGCKIDSPRRRQLLKQTLNGFCVANNNGVLEVTATKSDFAERQHALIQSILAVNDIYFTASISTQLVFGEVVNNWMHANKITYQKDLSVAGKSGLKHVFDFAVPATKESPLRLVHHINKPNREQLELFAFKLVDTEMTRERNSMAIAVLNDTNTKISEKIVRAVQTYNFETVLWSHRDWLLHRLAA